MEEDPTKAQRSIAHFLLVLTILGMSCDVSTLMNYVVPTPVPGLLNTIVALTAGAASTRTALVTALSAVPTFTASFTPVPSNTPTETLSPTPTFHFVFPTHSRTPTPLTPKAGYDCTLLAQWPSDGSVIAGNNDFTALWTVRNTGSHDWNSNTVDFVYLSGAKLSKLKVADLPASVATGNKITLKISMTAPDSSGTYRTVWTLQAGKTQFCRLTMSIVAK